MKASPVIPAVISGPDGASPFERLISPRRQRAATASGDSAQIGAAAQAGKNAGSVAIGVDVGGSHVAVGIVDRQGNLTDWNETKISDLDPPEKVLKIVADGVNRLAAKRSDICGVGIGLPGRHNSKGTICLRAPQFPNWHNVHVTSYLAKATGLPVHMMNDVTMATLGEYYFGEGKGTKNMVMLAIGTGIGGGIIADGKLLSGAKGRAGEVGHITVQPHGPMCKCGSRGCLEALASGSAISGRAAAAVASHEPTLLRQKVQSVEHLNAKVVTEAALEGDKVARRILQEVGQAIGIGVAMLAVTLNPEKVIIGGGVSLSGEPLFSAIRKEVDARMHVGSPKDLSIVPAKLGSQAGLIGAGAYALLRSGVNLQ